MTSQEDKDARCPTCGLSPTAIQKQDERIEKLSKRVEEQARELDELKKRLSLYENSNTPPSNSLIYREMKKKRNEERQNGSTSPSSASNNNKKPGRKDGHKGVTQTFELTGEPIIHTLDRCPIAIRPGYLLHRRRGELSWMFRSLSHTM